MTIDLRTSTGHEVLRATRVLARIDEVARAAGVRYLVVGATARSLISIGMSGTSPERATRDIDIAAEVDSWREFDDLVRDLPRRGGRAHTFLVEGTEVDVVPYGGIEGANRTIRWPDDREMSVLGLREAVGSAQTVLLPDGVSVRVPSIPALALLKLFAWRDRHLADRRDALDLELMITWYSSGAHFDRLFDEHMDVLERFGDDVRQAGAGLLGSGLPALLDDRGVAELLGVLDDRDLLGRLAADMRASDAALLVRALRQGVRDAVDLADRPADDRTGPD